MNPNCITYLTRIGLDGSVPIILLSQTCKTLGIPSLSPPEHSLSPLLSTSSQLSRLGGKVQRSRFLSLVHGKWESIKVENVFLIILLNKSSGTKIRLRNSVFSYIRRVIGILR